MEVGRRLTRYVVALVATLFAPSGFVQAQTEPDAEAAAWAAAKRIGTRTGYEQFLLHFSQGKFADLAIERLVELTLDESDEVRPASPGTRDPGRTGDSPTDLY